ncbi:MAG: hypothetical protein OEU68_08050 [Nitrospira sp.]|nr:hypothetical protein [Nitrospira sp.]MDH4242225.1 hypothetical protein [Nitrospira sp.]MDH4356285.1 hypothetical protein [Nitrospira sp.]MDH5317621.1 hypothetical protein [Nitrospira sp.]
MGVLKDAYRWLKDAWLALLLPPLCLLLLIKRLHYGIDFTDESFYVALAYRFAMGDQPFVDEYNLAQISGVLLVPFVSAFLLVNGGQPDGLVLFVRYLHLGFSVLVATIIFLALRRCLPWQFSLLCALMAVVFTPLGLHSISYITLGSGFFTVGCFLALWSVRNPQDGRLPLMAGVAHGLAVISYPTLIIPSVFSVVITTMWCPDKVRVRHAFCFYIGGLLVGVVPCVMLLRAGYQNVETAMAYVLSIGAQGGGIEKFVNGTWTIWDNFPHKSAVVLGFIGILVLRRKDTVWANHLLFMSVLIIPIGLITTASLWTLNALPVETLYLVINIGLMAPVLVCLLWNRTAARDLFRLAWIPSFIAGLVVCWSSGNGARMAAIGMLPAAIVSLALLASSLSWRNAGALERPPQDATRGGLVIVLVLCVFLANQFVGLYRDEPIGDLDTKIRSGPYKGIFTTKTRDKFLRELSSDIGAIAKKSDKILFFDDFPAGYLMSTLRPATPTVWLNPSSAYPTVDRTINEKYYARSGIQPDLVVRLKRIPRPDDPGLRYPEDDPVVRYVRARYKKCLERADYEIYVKQETLEQLAG